MKKQQLAGAAFVLSLATTSSLHADEEEYLESVFGDVYFELATGTKKQISKAPAVATVITADDIEKLGATDIDDVLETVPGLHVSKAGGGLLPKYQLRGIDSEFNPHLLILINGIPITNLYLGNRGQAWGGMPVKNISRIEIIRGPGSAVFGADAFSGVVNIITKTIDDINGTEIGGRVGSFNTSDVWALHGKKYGKFDVSFAFEYHKTDGYDEIVDVDAQTLVDQQMSEFFIPPASLAPGQVNVRRDNIDARVDIGHDNWRYRFGFQSRRNGGTGAGGAQALDPEGQANSNKFNADITYSNNEAFQHWDISSQLSYIHVSNKTDLVISPPGAATPFGAFPEGVIGNPYKWERHTRLGISGIYSGFDSHALRLGAGYIKDDIYKVQETKNFMIADGATPPIPVGTPLPLGSLLDVTNDPNSVFMLPKDREDYYLFLQDEIKLMPDLELTAGVRYDDYSDFGTTANPRAALVWANAYNMTTKFLYGRAFRAPSMAELYSINNPVFIGNPNLDPETIDTYEIAVDYETIAGTLLKANLFSYKMKDIIRFVLDNPALPATSSTTAQNAGEQTGYGLELEGIWSLPKGITLIGNYAYQKSTDEIVNADSPNAPQRQLYLRVEKSLPMDIDIIAQVNRVMGRKRDASDPRNADVDDYTRTDLTLRRSNASSPWEYAFTVHNVFDEDIREPSPAPGLIPNDLPMPGINYYLEASYNFGE